MSSIKDFMAKLEAQSDEGVIYSKKQEDAIRVIPPDNTEVQEVIEKPKPEVKPSTIKTKELKQDKKQEIKKEIKQDKKENKAVNLKLNIDTKALKENELFRASCTSIKYKDKWLEIYRESQSSRKKTSTVDAIKQGKFAITMDGSILILPDYDFRGKDVDDIIKSGDWLKK